MIVCLPKKLVRADHWLCFTQHKIKFMNIHMLVFIMPEMFSTNNIIFQFLQERLLHFFHDCIDCQVHKHKKMKHTKGAILQFSKLSTFHNHSISMDTKGPINPASEGRQNNYVIVDHFSNYIIIVLTTEKKGHYAVNSIFRHWIPKLGPLKIWLQIREFEYLITQSASCWNLLKIRPSPKLHMVHGQ